VSGEADLYGELAIDATRLDHRMWRNNVGKAKYRDRYGKVFVVPYGIPGPGGSDMLGYTKRKITPEMVGQTIAVFTAAECKRKGKKAEDDQAKFLEAVRNAGGISGVVRSVEDYRKLVGAE
jgi:hypothetical protein